MANVNISIKEEAYRYLKSLKDKNKSFSDIILEIKKKESGMKGSKERLMRFFGVLENSNWKTMEKKMKEFRREFEDRLK